MLSEVDHFFASQQPIAILSVKARNLLAKRLKNLQTKIVDTQSSVNTIFSLVNMLLGSSMVVFPILFKKMGILTNLMVEVIIFIITLLTTQLYVRHNRKEETDFSYTLRRVMGKRHLVFYSLNNVILLIFVGIIQFVLIIQMFHPVISFILFVLLRVEVAPFNEFTFSQFSSQWGGILWAIVLFIFCQQKSNSFLIKLTQYGFLSILFIVLFNIIKGAENIDQVNQLGKSEESPLITMKFASLAGIFLFAFLSHALVIPILKNNEKQENNKRDIFIAYAIVGSVYALIGLSGGLALIGKQPREGSNGEIILDFYPKSDILSLLVQFFLMFQMMAVLPLLQFSSRQVFYSLFYGRKDPPEFQTVVYNIVYIIILLVFQFTNVNLSAIISISGAVVSFFLIFYFPICVHLKCTIYNMDAEYKGNNHLDQYVVDKNSIKKEQEEGDEITLAQGKEKKYKNQNYHKIIYERRKLNCSDICSILFYSIVMLLGMAIAGYMLYEMFESS